MAAVQINRQDKLDKIDAEIARMEVEMELERSDNASGSVCLGAKLPDGNLKHSNEYLGPSATLWNSVFGKTDTPAEQMREKSNDIAIFQNKVLNVVCSKLGFTAVELARIDPFWVGGRVVGLVPANVWRIATQSNSILVFFWVGESASCSVVVETVTGPYDSSKTGVLHVWSTKKANDGKKDSKNYSMVRAQLHGTILLRSGGLPEYDVP